MTEGVPDNSDCETAPNSCIIGEKIIIIGQKIEKQENPRAHGQHRKQQGKVKNGKCWIEKPLRNLTSN